MQELGSEFWETGKIKINTVIDPYTRNLLSGRTALDFIIKDIKFTRRINSILIPSYCCESMIEPFLRNNVNLVFYDPLKMKNIDILSHNVDALLIIDYFGYQRIDWKDILDRIDDSKIIIYDSTHSLLGNKNIENIIDYSFISYRKWFFTNHCVVKKNKRKFNLEQPFDMNLEYINLRKKAAKYKKHYIEQNKGCKDFYLRLFSKAESILESDYVDYMGIPEFTSLEEIIKKRKENAQYLIEELKDLSNLELLYNTVEEKDIPLFVPIIVNENRDLLRQVLIDNDIYCPVHWPFSNIHKRYSLDSIMYNRELSLICDQRYNLKDMERQVKIIREFSLEIK